MFDSKWIDSQTYCDWPLHYDPLLPEFLTDADGTKRQLDTGVRILENGDVSFRLYAPNAGTIQVQTKLKSFSLVKQPDGMFTGVLPYDPLFVGPHSIDFIVDGVCFLSPYVPISWHRNRPVNYLDLPDPQTPYIHIRDVPHGSVSRALYWSKTMGRYERCMIYTPPGYMKNTQSYPVLYLQHGATENEITWEYNGRVSAIMDNLIAQGTCRPMLVVMNNGMIRYPGTEGFLDNAFEDNLLNDCMPYIQDNYRVKNDRRSRAIAGLSMGSMQASMIGLTHPELFSWIGVFSGFMRARYDKDPQSIAHLAALQDREAFLKNYGLFFRSIGDLDTSMARFEQDDDICAQTGIDALPNYKRVVYANQYHEFGAWRRALHDFVQLIF